VVALRARGIDLIAADGPSSFDDTPTARLIRQVLGAVSEFQKAMLVAKLRGRVTASAARA
jgi:DNA invertase Pin-like site-specific DNA recombinase